MISHRTQKTGKLIHVFNIAAWNAKWLTQSIQEVELFLNILKIDILLVSKHHFTERIYVKIPPYTKYAINHPDGRSHVGQP
jgi:hypothetical protein